MTPTETRIRVYNETRATVISLYQRLKKHMRQEDAEESEEEDVDEIPDFFPVEDEESLNDEFLYVVKKSLIIDEWKKRRALMARNAKRRAKEMEEDAGGALKNSLINSLRKKIGRSGSNSNAHSKQSSWGGNLAAAPKEKKIAIGGNKNKDLQS